MSAALLSTILSIVATVIDLYIFVVFAAVIASWLVAFGVFNIRNDFVRRVLEMLNALTDPVFRAIRRFIPPIGGFDFSPLVVLIALYAILRFFAIAFSGYYYGPLI
jgi:YggT family protein